MIEYHSSSVPFGWLWKTLFGSAFLLILAPLIGEIISCNFYWLFYVYALDVYGHCDTIGLYGLITFPLAFIIVIVALIGLFISRSTAKKNPSAVSSGTPETPFQSP
jgi:hypothetical protein